MEFIWMPFQPFQTEWWRREQKREESRDECETVEYRGSLKSPIAVIKKNSNRNFVNKGNPYRSIFHLKILFLNFSSSLENREVQMNIQRNLLLPGRSRYSLKLKLILHRTLSTPSSFSTFV